MKYLERKAKAFKSQKQQWLDEMERIDARNKDMLEITLAILPPHQTEMREMIQQGLTQEGIWCKRVLDVRNHKQYLSAGVVPKKIHRLIRLNNLK